MSKPAGGWKRFLCVGCSHGHCEDPLAIKAVLKFKRTWKPHRTIHLGDFIDTAAFRSGAIGTPDEASQIGPDLGHGLNFLKALEPTDILNGNHEIRLYKAAEHYNAVTSYAAQSMIDDIRNVARGLKAQYIEHYDINRSWITIGDTKFLHGWMYGENSIRDHAEQFGRVCHAHVHQAAQVMGRRSDNPLGTSVGMLADRDKLTYAHTRRATSRWSLGFAYGEYRDDACHINISRCDCGNAINWRLPV